MTEQTPGGEPQRRRGARLEVAIYTAVLDELAETSFEELTFDRIAARAGAGKASVYRRWADTAELTLAALSSYDIPILAKHPNLTGRLRDDLVAVLLDLGEGLDAPHGGALLGLMSHRARHPQLYKRVVDLMVRPRQRIIGDLLHSAVERGEIEAAAVTPVVAAAGPQLVLAHYQSTGHVSLEHIEAVVDQVLLPSLRRPTEVLTKPELNRKESIS